MSNNDRPIEKPILENEEEHNELELSQSPKTTQTKFSRSSGKLSCYDWLGDLPESHKMSDLVEVQFKNTRKGYFRNTNNLPIERGDLVAVESSPGHDIGTVTLMGKLVQLQMKKNAVRTDPSELKRVYRKAKPNDLEKWEEAKSREHDTMLRSRKIAESLHLNMKIGDVEYQGDGNKAIFYYIADERVDFRQLIKILAETFRIRIEMKQIGARQEAGRIGGIGPCGRPLCCSGWMSNFVSVATSAARYQDISLNPQKLAGQCAKLKCCLNFEVDTYVESHKKLPSREIHLETKDATYYHFKTDIFKQELTYSTSRDVPANLATITADRVFEIIALNKKGLKPDELGDINAHKEVKKEFEDVVGQDSLTRFDKSKKRPSNNGGGGNRNNRSRNSNRGGEQAQQSEQPRERNNRPKRPIKRNEGGDRPAGERTPKPQGEQTPNEKGGNNRRPNANAPQRKEREGGEFKRPKKRPNTPQKREGNGSGNTPKEGTPKE